MDIKFFKKVMKLSVSILCLTKASSGYSSLNHIYGELVDGEWVNRTVHQICADVVNQELNRSRNTQTTTVDLSTNSLVVLGASAAAGYIAATWTLEFTQHYVIPSIKWCFGSITFKNPTEPQSLNVKSFQETTVEDLMPQSINVFHKRLINNLEHTIWDSKDQIGGVNSKGWTKKVNQENRGRTITYDSLFYSVKFVETNKFGYTQYHPSNNPIRTKEDRLKIDEFIKSFHYNKELSNENSSLNSLIDAAFEDCMLEHKCNDKKDKYTKEIILNFGTVPLKTSSDTDKTNASTQTEFSSIYFAFPFKRVTPFVLMITNKNLKYKQED